MVGMTSELPQLTFLRFPTTVLYQPEREDDRKCKLRPTRPRDRIQHNLNRARIHRDTLILLVSSRYSEARSSSYNNSVPNWLK